MIIIFLITQVDHNQSDFKTSCVIDYRYDMLFYHYLIPWTQSQTHVAPQKKCQAQRTERRWMEMPSPKKRDGKN